MSRKVACGGARPEPKLAAGLGGLSGLTFRCIDARRLGQKVLNNHE
jgi:hypothetical protein